LIALAQPGHYRCWCADRISFLLSSPFVHPLRRGPERECGSQQQVLHETNLHERPGEIMIVRPGSAISSNPTRFGEWSEWDERIEHVAIGNRAGRRQGDLDRRSEQFTSVAMMPGSALLG
jgi:hypothetical protein